MRTLRLALALLGCAAASWSQTPAPDPLATAQLVVQGAHLTLDPADVQRLVNVGEPAVIRTCFGGVEAPCGQVAPTDPRIAGLDVQAELSGPELPQPVTVHAKPGGSFLLPGFRQPGDYLLENIRLLDDHGRVLGGCEPPVAVIQVAEIMLTSATVTTLTLADLQARGITISQESFQAYNFAVGFAFDGKPVTIEFPVLYTGNGGVEALAKPEFHGLDDLLPDTVKRIERWQPPSITPFRLETPAKDLLEEEDEENQTFRPPVFGAIVLPGTISFLDQFFDARLVVANGAPAGSGAMLQNVMAALHLPDGNVLRVAQTDPAVAVGQPVPVKADGGSFVIAPASQGKATWTVEGLKRGTHTLRMDISAGERQVPVTRATTGLEHLWGGRGESNRATHGNLTLTM